MKILIVILLILTGCRDVPSEIIYIDKDTGAAVEVPAAKLKPMYHQPDVTRVCIGGYQAFRFAQNYGYDYLWVPSHYNSQSKLKCTANTLANGEDIE